MALGKVATAINTKEWSEIGYKLNIWELKALINNNEFAEARFNTIKSKRSNLP